MSVESDIRDAAHLDKARLWHHKGHYSIIVTEIIRRGDVEWVHYFVEQNCDLTLEEFDDSFVRANVQNDERITTSHLVHEQHFKDNTVRVMSMERAVKKFRKKKPSGSVKVEVFTI